MTKQEELKHKFYSPAEFFSRVQNTIDEIKNTYEHQPNTYGDMPPIELIGEFDWPVHYTVAKWAHYKITGKWPSDEDVLKYGCCYAGVKEEEDRFVADMNYQFGQGGW